MRRHDMKKGGLIVLVLAGLLYAGETPAVKLGGFIQAVGYAGIADTAASVTDQFVLRRARLDVRINSGGTLEGRIHGDLACSAPLLDAYLKVKLHPAFAVTFGKFKHPLSQERAQSVPSLMFNDFSYTAQIAPNRDLGIRVSGDFANRTFFYQAAILNGAQDGSSASGDASDHKEAAGRLSWKPFANSGHTGLKSFTLGFGASYGLQTDEAPGSVCTPVRTKVFAYHAAAKGDGPVLRYSPQIAWYGGKITLIGEYVVADHHVSLNGAQETDLRNRAGSLSLAWAIGGGARKVSGFSPVHALDISCGDWGGLELVARIHGFFADAETFPLYASALSSVSRVITAEGGLAWYAADNTCLKLIYTASHFKGGAPDGDRSPERALTLTGNLTF
ncbi:MAG: hypothetical protein JXR21_00465 [Candidatus Marinimicrobia bacterium]|nr:hypothetical protein [Candidatus Neomarinimicrobiota bacterium]